MKNMQRKSAIEMFAVFSNCCFYIHHCQSQQQCFSFLIARENVFHPCKIGWTLYGVRLISYNVVRAPYGARPGIGR